MVIAVHDGLFHMDDVIAVALAMMETEYLDTTVKPKVVRTRNEGVLASADIVLDVGKKCDGVKYFDHHQNDVPVYSNGIKYAACGLYLENMQSLTDGEKQYLLDNALYAVQAYDNGQDLDELGLSLPENPFTFVQYFNGTWKEGVYNSGQDSDFHRAMMQAGSIIRRMLTKYEHAICANAKISSALESKLKNNNGILFIGQYCDWIEKVVEYNKKNHAKTVKVVVYSNSKGEYNVRVVPKEVGSFESYVSIPREVEDIEGCIFRHKTGFLAGFDNVLGALEAAKITVESK